MAIVRLASGFRTFRRAAQIMSAINNLGVVYIPLRKTRMTDKMGLHVVVGYMTRLMEMESDIARPVKGRNEECEINAGNLRPYMLGRCGERGSGSRLRATRVQQSGSTGLV
jgi:hypothetical protein